MTTTIEIEGTEQVEAQLAEMREREGELEALREETVAASRTAREDLISRRADPGAVDIALSRQAAIESALSELRTRIAQREAELAAKRQAARIEEQKGEALAASAKAEELFYAAMLDARKIAVAALLACPKAKEFVRLRQESHAATQDALTRLLELTQGDREQAVALLERHGINPHVLQTRVYTPDRYLDRRGGGWSLPVEPLFKAYPSIDGGELLAIVADFIEFGVLVPPDHHIQLGG